MTKDKTNKPMDLGEIDTGAASDKGFDLELLHPTNGKPTGAFVTVLGKHSQAFRDHIRETGNERMRKEAQAERKGKPVDPVTIEEAERGALELLVICTTGWYSVERDKDGKEISRTPTIPFKGEDLPFNAANALKVYGERIWIRTQVDDAIGDLENFM